MNYVRETKIPEDTKNIKVGTLVGLMVLPGEDWKSVQIPEGETTQPAATAAAPKQSTPVVKQEPVTTSSSSSSSTVSHHKIDAHILENL